MKENIFKIKGHRIGNPIPEEQRVAKCLRCKQHRYFKDMGVGHVCKICEQERMGHNEPKASTTDRPAQGDSLEGIGHAGDGTKVGDGNSGEDPTAESTGRDAKDIGGDDERGE